MRLGGGRILQEIEKEFNFSPMKELLKVELGIPSFLEQKKELRFNKIRGFILPSPGEGKSTKVVTKQLLEIGKWIKDNTIYEEK